MGKIVDLNQFILQLEKAVANGVATLDSSVKVPKSQISLSASDVGAIAANDSNAVLATLNAASGTISSSILPSYVDDFLTFANLAAFPVTGESGKIYLAENTNLSYRWTGASYVDISSAGISDATLKLNTPRTIASTGDGSWSVNFDGSVNASAALTLATVNSNTGSFGSSTQIPTLTIDAKGRIISASNSSIGNELIAIQALTDTVGFLRKTGDGAYSIDTNSYLPLTGGTVSGDLNIEGAFFANKLIGAWNQGIYLGSSDTLNYSPSAIEIPTNTAYGGIYSNYTGARICCGEMIEWGTAQIQFYISTNWKTYHSTPCFTAQNGSIRIPQSAKISISTPGKIGTICWDSNYIYVCTATNTWKRASLSSW